MKNILVTGANRGLGLGLVKKFLKIMKKFFVQLEIFQNPKNLILCKKKYNDNP